MNGQIGIHMAFCLCSPTSHPHISWSSSSSNSCKNGKNKPSGFSSPPRPDHVQLMSRLLSSETKCDAYLSKKCVHFYRFASTMSRLCNNMKLSVLLFIIFHYLPSIIYYQYYIFPDSASSCTRVPQSCVCVLVRSEPKHFTSGKDWPRDWRPRSRTGWPRDWLPRSEKGWPRDWLPRSRKGWPRDWLPRSGKGWPRDWLPRSGKDWLRDWRPRSGTGWPRDWLPRSGTGWPRDWLPRSEMGWPRDWRPRSGTGGQGAVRNGGPGSGRTAAPGAGRTGRGTGAPGAGRTGRGKDWPRDWRPRSGKVISGTSGIF